MHHGVVNRGPEQHTAASTDRPGRTTPMVVHLGHEELVIRKRYEMLSIANDLLIGIWFLVGSFLFFSPSTTTAGTWLFVLGSVEMLIRPAIRFVRGLHLQRFDPNSPAVGPGSGDY